jgi:DNA-binding GntR family transcriptional regulator
MTTDPTSPAEEVLDVLVQSTYQAIKDAILGNRLRPGHKLIHQALAENLGVSRTPVRESLERLYQEGYVTRIANRGYFVAEIDVQEVRDLYQTREALEVYALQLIFKAGLQSQALSQLEAINARYKKLCMESLSRERLLVDREFHLALAALSGNRYLHKTLGSIFDRLILKRRVEGFHDLRGIEPFKDHVSLLAAIKAGDQASALGLLSAHITGASARFIQYLEPAANALAAAAVPAAKVKPAGKKVVH